MCVPFFDHSARRVCCRWMCAVLWVSWHSKLHFLCCCRTRRVIIERGSVRAREIRILNRNKHHLRLRSPWGCFSYYMRGRNQNSEGEGGRITNFFRVVWLMIFSMLFLSYFIQCLIRISLIFKLLYKIHKIHNLSRNLFKFFFCQRNACLDILL